MADLSVEIAGIKLKNPVLMASGTFGYGKEPSQFIDIRKLGGIITKSITLLPKEGNPPPRTAETPSGMLNTIGLQNEGIETFTKKALPFLSGFKIPVIVNIAGEKIEEYAELAKRLSKESVVKALEVNISCPNVKKGGMSFGIDPDATAQVIKAVKKETNLPIIAKLTPNVTDIILIAKAAEKAGADAISLINTVLGMAIDVETWKPRISRGIGGLSGPAIKPIGVRMVYEVSKAVKIPVIGIGGIMSVEDAIEYLLAGASAIQVGTANFVDPETPLNIIDGLEVYMKEKKLPNLKSIIGKVAT